MKTAQELATSLELYARYRDDNKGSALKAAAMLRQQAEQIDQLGRWKSTHAPRIEALEGLLATTQRQVSTSREAAQMLKSERQANAILTDENEALKAALNDAATSLNTISRLAGNEFYIGEDGERVETYMKHPDQIRGYASSRYSATIDAMKGKS